MEEDDFKDKGLFVLGAIFLLIGGTLFCYGKAWPWYSYALAPLAALFMYYSSVNEAKRWRKSVAEFEKYLDWKRRYVEALEKEADAAEAYLENQEYMLALYRESLGLPAQEERWSEATRRKMINLYFRAKNKGKITIH